MGVSRTGGLTQNPRGGLVLQEQVQQPAVYLWARRALLTILYVHLVALIGTLFIALRNIHLVPREVEYICRFAPEGCRDDDVLRSINKLTGGEPYYLSGVITSPEFLVLVGIILVALCFVLWVDRSRYRYLPPRLPLRASD